MMKWLLLVSIMIFSSSLWAAKMDCEENAKNAARALEVINSNTTKSNIEVVRHELLGRIMILTGYLLKYETELKITTKNDTKSYYQSYVLEDDCTVQEMKKIEPFDYH